MLDARAIAIFHQQCPCEPGACAHDKTLGEDRLRVQFIRDGSNQGVAQRRRSDITDPHTCERRHEHEDEEHHTWVATSSIEDTRGGHDVQTGLGQHGSNRETTDKQHDGRREHLGEDVPVVRWMSK